MVNSGHEQLRSQIEEVSQKITITAKHLFNCQLNEDENPSMSNAPEEKPKQGILARIENANYILKNITTTAINFLTSPEENCALNPGKQLTSNYLNAYISELSETINKNETNKPLIYNSSFLHSNIENFTINEIMEILHTIKQSKEYIDHKGEVSIVIPIVFGNNGIFERNHIVLVTIENNNLYYFDSKGVSSANITYNSKISLQQVIKLFLDGFAPGGKIIENSKKMQYDINNCGPNICVALKRHFIEKKSYPDIFNSTITQDDILGIRKEIFLAWEKKYKPSAEELVKEFEDDVTSQEERAEQNQQDIDEF